MYVCEYVHTRRENKVQGLTSPGEKGSGAKFGNVFLWSATAVPIAHT